MVNKIKIGDYILVKDKSCVLKGQFCKVVEIIDNKWFRLEPYHYPQDKGIYELPKEYLKKLTKDKALLESI